MADATDSASALSAHVQKAIREHGTTMTNVHPDLSLWGGPTTPKAGDWAAKVGGLQYARNMLAAGMGFALKKNDAARQSDIHQGASETHPAGKDAPAVGGPFEVQAHQRISTKGKVQSVQSYTRQSGRK